MAHADSPSSAPPPAAARPLTLIHFGDLHVWSYGWDADAWPKRLLGLVNLALRRSRRFPPAVATKLADRLQAEQADWMLFSGDIATTALRAEFLTGRATLEPIFTRWRDRLLAVPGNHDQYTPRAARRRLYETLFLREATRDCPFTVDLDDRWSLIGLNLCVPRFCSSRGRLAHRQLQGLREQLAAARARDRRIIVTGHYPLVYPPGMRVSWEHVLPDRERLLRELTDADVRLYLHGHKHVRWHLRAGGIDHLNCGSAGMTGGRPERQPGYLRLTLDANDLLHVEAVRLASPPETDPARWEAARTVPVVITPASS